MTALYWPRMVCSFIFQSNFSIPTEILVVVGLPTRKMAHFQWKTLAAWQANIRSIHGRLQYVGTAGVPRWVRHCCAAMPVRILLCGRCDVEVRSWYISEHVVWDGHVLPTGGKQQESCTCSEWAQIENAAITTTCTFSNLPNLRGSAVVTIFTDCLLVVHCIVPYKAYNLIVVNRYSSLHAFTWWKYVPNAQ